MDRRKFMQAAAIGAAAVGASATGAEAQKSSIPIIDTHVHLYDPTRPQGIPWPNKDQPASIYRRFLPGDYAKIAEPHGVVGAIETECSPWIEDNYWVMDVSKNEPIMVGEVGDLLLGHPDYREHLERLHRNPLYVGIRVSNLWGRNVKNCSRNRRSGPTSRRCPMQVCRWTLAAASARCGNCFRSPTASPV